MNRKFMLYPSLIILLGISYMGFLHMKIAFNKESEVPKNAEYLIILGTRVIGENPSPLLQKRIDVALEYLKENNETIVIATGGQGSNEDLPEAVVIKQELIRNGIEEKRILVEDKSSRTVENISLSKRFLKDDPKNIVVVSNAFHIYRAKLIASDQGIELKSIPAETPKEDMLKWYFREYLAITKYYLERVGL